MQGQEHVFHSNVRPPICLQSNYQVYEYEILKSDEDESNEPKHLVPKMIFRLNKEKDEDPKESKPVQAKAQVPSSK